jgi:eukaryotic-like serine/threonine-protein kinase
MDSSGDSRGIAAFVADRFEVRGTLGAGGAGIVYRVFDRQLGREVGLKVLRQATGRDLYRFKREFRSLTDIFHPNLVALHELHANGDAWFFTMELVEGVSFMDWVRPSATESKRPRTRGATIEDPLNEARLRACLIQLCDALVALHQSHKLHRDLKPSNVVVTAAGRAVLLDFGLVAGLAEIQHEHLAVGTPAYMSPEQAADLPLTPASDWYGVGAMIYEALTGLRPFEGDAEQVMRKKQTEIPIHPSEYSENVPSDLASLALALLHPVPAQRPDGLHILSLLGTVASNATRDVARNHARSLFIGRIAQLNALRSTFADSRRRGNAVFVNAASGMGKSSLVREALAQLTEHAFVLEGRCFERESVPFKMLDGVIDAIASVLVSLDATEVTALQPRELVSLLRLFPVMRRVPQFTQAAADMSAPVDLQELRLRGFASLRQLLSKLAKLRPVFIFIDDVHWGDHDSATFMAELLHRPDTNMCVIMAHRPEDYLGVVAALHKAPGGNARGSDVRELLLPPMNDDDAQQLVLTITPDLNRAQMVLPAAQGNPLVISELARADGANAGVGIDALVASRASRLSEEGQALLVVTSVAGRPLPVDIAARAAGLQDGHEIALQLSVERLTVLRRVGGQMVLQPAHDYVRAAVVGALSTDVKAAWHEALASALETAPGVVDCQAVVEHWLAAGHPAKAAEYAIPAALLAEQALAFRRAADLYRVALAYGNWDATAQRDLLRRQAQALTAGGQLDEAATAYGHSAQLIGDSESVDLERLRLEQLLRRGRVEDALPAAERLLATVGLKLQLTGKWPMAKLATQWVSQRMRGLDFQERPINEISVAELRQIDVLYSIASGLGFCDPVRGRMVQGEFLRAALSVGEPFRVCMALSQEIVYHASSGPKSWPTVETMATKLKAIGMRVGHPHIIGVIDTSIGLAAHLCGRWRESRMFMEAGLATLRNYGTGVRWEVDMGEMYWLGTLYYLGDWREFTRMVQALLRDATERGDLISQFWLRVGRCSFAWLIADQPQSGYQQVAIAERMLGDNYATVHHVYALLARVNIDLYCGAFSEASTRLYGAWPTLERMFVLRVQNLRIELVAVKARLAIANGLSDGNVKLARAAIDDLLRESAPWGQAMGHLMQGALYAFSKQVQAAQTALAKAESLFAENHMEGWRQVARYRKAMMIDGPQGKAQAAAAIDTLTEVGTVAPLRLIDAMAPWPTL